MRIAVLLPSINGPNRAIIKGIFSKKQVNSSISKSNTMQVIEENRLETIILELEKKYPCFKKMDIYTTVKNSYNTMHSFFKNISDRELEKIKNIADQDLRLSM
jgi:hypothetical protein